MSKIESVTGRAVAVHGDDIDTDRIIPARFLKTITFEGLDQVFREAGFEWRGAGCSMCLGMNPDKLQGAEVCASSSNRNFKGRQGSPTGRTVLMSPVMVMAAAVTGEVSDAREVFGVLASAPNA